MNHEFDLQKGNYRMNTLTRREWLRIMAVLPGAMLLPEWLTAGAKRKKNPTLLVVSGWQDINIGDIAHTPGLLHILETYLPDAKIILWKKSSLNEEVNRMLHQNFPRVKIIYGSVGPDKTVTDPEILKAFEEADMMVHGSGPSVVGMDHLSAWHSQTGKPFGIFGTTIQTISEQLLLLLQKASFIFTRETASISVLKNAGISGLPILFAPDATFLLNVRNDQKALPFLAEKGLEPGKYICAVPRLRYTPYHKIRQTDWSEEKIRQVEETNEKYKEADHAKLREAIITYVRSTKNKVLVCPEMTYQVDIMDELLIDPLPGDVKPFVLKRGYWLPDEAASVYARARAVLSFECHSPIIALANNVPAFYLRQPEDTIKGQMYYDLGADDWIFEIDQTSGKQIADRLMGIVSDPEQTAAKVKSIQKNVKICYKKAIEEMKQVYERI
jgi:polysaccharide pyruvyl transferase WcaK-like protein